MTNRQAKITSSIKTTFMLSITISLVSAGVFVGSDTLFASAKKPAAVIEWSNGFPSGEHSNLNIHGKKLDFNCNNSGEGVEDYGSSIFVPIESTPEDPSKIYFVSNKRSSLDHLKVIDPCADPFGVEPNIDPALVQLPKGDHQVYWRILGKPNNGNNGPSEAMLTFPRLIDQCNFLDEVPLDEGGDAINCDDETLVGLGLVTRNGVFKKTDEGLERFDTTAEKGKGKSKAIEITDLFLWTGVVCDSILDLNMDGELTQADFPGLTEADVAAAGVIVNDNDIIDNAEFQAYLATLAECELFTEEWVFNIADIVIYGLDYVNNGSTLTQMRFYPVETTEFS